MFDSVDRLLGATQRVVIATGILNLWMHLAETAANYAALTAAHGDRFLLGIGVSHAPLIDASEPGRYRKPLAATRSISTASTPRTSRCRCRTGCWRRSAPRCWPWPPAGPVAPTRT